MHGCYIAMHVPQVPGISFTHFELGAWPRADLTPIPWLKPRCAVLIVGNIRGVMQPPNKQ